MSMQTTPISAPLHAKSVSDHAESEDGLIDTLMHLLDDDTVDNMEHFEARDRLPEKLGFCHFKLGENGHCNFRDGTVLGKPPGITLPAECRPYENILLSIYLHAEYDPSDELLLKSCRVTAPVFCNENMKTVHGELQHVQKTEPHQLWVKPNTLGTEMTLLFKKRDWDLSRMYRKVSKSQWPQFVIVATPMVNGTLMPNKAVRTPTFEIRSKEQANKSAAARGLASSVPTKRRRTPLTDAAASKLHQIQAGIVQLRTQILNAKQSSQDYETRVRFMMAIAETDPQFQQLYQQMSHSFLKIKHNSEKRM